MFNTVMNVLYVISLVLTVILYFEGPELRFAEPIGFWHLVKVICYSNLLFTTGYKTGFNMSTIEFELYKDED